MLSSAYTIRNSGSELLSISDLIKPSMQTQFCVLIACLVFPL